MTDDHSNHVHLSAKFVTVCDECLRASCWQGIFMCERSDEAGVAILRADYLLKRNLEDPSYWDETPEGLKAKRAVERRDERIATLANALRAQGATVEPFPISPGHEPLCLFLDYDAIEIEPLIDALFPNESK